MLNFCSSVPHKFIIRLTGVLISFSQHKHGKNCTNMSNPTWGGWSISHHCPLSAIHVANSHWPAMTTVFDLITAPALITAPFDFLLDFHLLSPTWRSFSWLLLYFHLLSPTWRSFCTTGREQIYVSAPGAY